MYGFDIWCTVQLSSIIKIFCALTAIDIREYPRKMSVMDLCWLEGVVFMLFVASSFFIMHHCSLLSCWLAIEMLTQEINEMKWALGNFAVLKWNFLSGYGKLNVWAKKWTKHIDKPHLKRQSFNLIPICKEKKKPSKVQKKGRPQLWANISFWTFSTIDSLIFLNYPKYWQIVWTLSSKTRHINSNFKTCIDDLRPIYLADNKTYDLTITGCSWPIHGNLNEGLSVTNFSRPLWITGKTIQVEAPLCSQCSSFLFCLSYFLFFFCLLCSYGWHFDKHQSHLLTWWWMPNDFLSTMKSSIRKWMPFEMLLTSGKIFSVRVRVHFADSKLGPFKHILVKVIEIEMN